MIGELLRKFRIGKDAAEFGNERFSHQCSETLIESRIKHQTRRTFPKQCRDDDICVNNRAGHSGFNLLSVRRSAFALVSSSSISCKDNVPSSFCMASRKRLAASARTSSFSIIAATLSPVIGTPSALACSTSSSGSLIVISTSLMGQILIENLVNYNIVKQSAYVVVTVWRLTPVVTASVGARR